MSWRDRDYNDDSLGRAGRPGGDWQGLRPSFDNPMTWSVPLMRLFDIAVRVHVVFLIYIVIELARSMPFKSPDVASAAPMDFPLTALQLGCLFTIVLVHEFGHCLACRRMGGSANEILMWPLGGLAYCQPVHHWRSHFITAAGGPMVNVVICAALAPLLWLVTGDWWGTAVPNPLALRLPELAAGGQPWWLLVLFFVHAMSWVLLLFNLLPIFPLDGGRLVQALLWSKFGYGRSMRLAVYAGYFGAIGLGIFGAVYQHWMLVAIAIFGGVTCYMTVKQLEWTESVMGSEESEYAASLWATDDADEPDDAHSKTSVSAARRAERKAARHAAAAATDSAELDRVLAKIAEHGMDSLSRGERRLLEDETERRRREAE